LNKADLVEEANLDALEVKIRDVKEGARILRTQQSKVPLPLILSVGLFESDRFFDPEDKGHKHDHDHDHEHGHHDHSGHDHHDHSACDHEHGHCEHDHEHDHEHSHDHGHEHHHHHSNHLEVDGFTSVSFQSDRPFAIKKFQYFLDNQLPETVFRAKGILWFDESPKRHVFHLSGKRFSLEDEEWKGQPKTQVVLIGQDLDHGTLRQQLESCLCLPSTNRGKGFGK
jgi:G3E family GTPase